MDAATTHLRNIARILDGWSEDNDESRTRLLAAANEYWSATFYSAIWTEQMREWGGRIDRLILSRGTIERTVQAMDAATARRTASELLRFAESAAATFVPPSGCSIFDDGP